MNRKARRAAEHKERKLACKAGFPASETPTTPAPATPPRTIVEVPEPGFPLPSLASLTNISDARLAANRANAQHSTGPVTEAGRAASCQNHTIHGLARHNGAFKILASEDAAGFKALKQSLAAEHLPTTETESILVNAMAESHWLANRAQNLQATCFDETTGQITDVKLFSLYLRYQTTHTRAFHKSLNDLVKLRAERRKSEHGFEAQVHRKEELRLENEKHEMKKQTHYWDLLRKDAEACHRVCQNVMQCSKAAAENPGFEAQYNAELAKHGLRQDYWQGAASAAA